MDSGARDARIVKLLVQQYKTRTVGPLGYGAFVEGVLLEAGLITNRDVAVAVNDELGRRERAAMHVERRQTVKYAQATGHRLGGFVKIALQDFVTDIEMGAHLQALGVGEGE